MTGPLEPLHYSANYPCTFALLLAYRTGKTPDWSNLRQCTLALTIYHYFAHLQNQWCQTKLVHWPCALCNAWLNNWFLAYLLINEPTRYCTSCIYIYIYIVQKHFLLMHASGLYFSLLSSQTWTSCLGRNYYSPVHIREVELRCHFCLYISQSVTLQVGTHSYRP